MIYGGVEGENKGGKFGAFWFGMCMYVCVYDGRNIRGH